MIDLIGRLEVRHFRISLDDRQVNQLSLFIRLDRASEELDRTVFTLFRKALPGKQSVRTHRWPYGLF